MRETTVLFVRFIHTYFKRMTLYADESANFLTFAAVKSAPCICRASMTTGMELEPCLTPAFETTDLTYSTEGNARLLSGVMRRYSQPELVCK